MFPRPLLLLRMNGSVDSPSIEMRNLADKLGIRNKEHAISFDIVFASDYIAR